MVITKNYNAPVFNEKEILRYAGCKGNIDNVGKLLCECKEEAGGRFSYRVCWLPLNASINGGYCDFGIFAVKSKDLARNLDGCDKAVIFAATVGVEIDRMIAKYSALSPAKALMFDAIGTERIESLCDMFCEDISKELKKFARPRFSPGYGDLDLSFQKEVFSVLNCQKHIGLTVTDSLIMSPSKSVTAIVGLCETNCEKTFHKCATCGNKKCTFRGDL